MSNTERKNVLVIGDAAGIAGEIALRFALEGDRPMLVATNRDSEGVGQTEMSTRAIPVIRQMNGFAPERIKEVLAVVREHAARVDVLIFAHCRQTPVASFAAYDEQALQESITENSWPLIEYTKQIQAQFGAFPKYVLGLSSTQLDRYMAGDDFTAVAQSLNEVFVKYLNYHLYSREIIFNMIRTLPDGDDSYKDMVARGLFGLTSGFMDAISGQTVIMNRNGFCTQ
jgi:NAD(P)-dependent dehydrogenase (short-subunit alcohol dehydrogenase family)